MSHSQHDNYPEGRKPATLLARTWARLHEPRIISAVYFVWWTLATSLGGYSVIFPPRTIEAAAGDVLMSIISAFLTIGGIVGMVTAARGTYWAERGAVFLVGISIGAYLAIVAYLWIVNEGHHGLQTLALIGAIGFTWIRLYWVTKRPYSDQQTGAIPLANGDSETRPGDQDA